MTYKSKKKHVRRACKNCKWYSLSIGICCNKDTEYMLKLVDKEAMYSCWVRRPGRLPLEDSLDAYNKSKGDHAKEL